MRSRLQALGRAALTIALGAAALATASICRAADGYELRASAPARAAPTDSVVRVPSRLDFNFGELRLWLTKTGEWQVEGEVSHRGLLCGTYEVGIRFGAGSPGCANVNWVSDVRYVTTRKQCNNATVIHTGGDIQRELTSPFPTITCAERVIRCTGNCK